MSRADVVVFSGPTLAPRRVAEELPGARCFGPVARGDILRALRHDPRVVCILDGLFGATLPVWHKEILWALQLGVRVFGAASMGALRAAELASFGMIGVGRVFQLYQDEEIEDEDEVTVMHAGPERDYRATSEALVDIRATLAEALRQAVIDEPTRARLVELARGTFYAERSYVALLRTAERDGLGAEGRARLEQFLSVESNHVHLKRADALECLSRIRQELSAGSQLDVVSQPSSLFEFAYTDAFDALVTEEALGDVSPADGSEERRALPSELLLEEIQLLGPDVFEPLLRQAAARALRVVMGQGAGARANTNLDLQVVREASPQAIGELERLLEELDLSPQKYRQWMDEEAAIRSVEEQTQDLVQAQFAPVLRALGDYPRIAQRARRKLEVCGAPLAPLPIVDASSIWREYFENVLNLDVPAHLDAYAASVGFGDQAQLLLAVARELEFRRLA